MKRITALCLSVVMLMVPLLYTQTSSNTASAATRSEIQAEIDAIEAEIQRAQDKVDSLDDETADEQEKLEALQEEEEALTAKVEALQSQVDVIDAEISTLDAEIASLETEISDLQVQIEQNELEIIAAQESIETTSEALESQLRSAYITGSATTLQLLMGSDSLATFLTRLELMKRASEEQTEAINAFKETTLALEESQSELDANKTSLDEKVASLEVSVATAESSKSELTSAQAEYEASIAEFETQAEELTDYISSLSADSEAYQTYIEEQYAAQIAKEDELDAALEAYYAEQALLDASNSDSGSSNSSSDSTSSSGTVAGYDTSTTWAWPLGNFSCYISSAYGYRDASVSGWSFHGGTDISGGSIYGAPIYATRSGTVILAQTWDNGGYGIYTSIDHGDGFISIYGHCSQIIVSVGQYVEKGEVIAYVGSTGNSTGAHLHFELRYDGEKVDPMNYVSMP
ncbi:MAG: peptidoglycan DD-metalloendopeptidase family protein [Clostridia bacterium]